MKRNIDATVKESSINKKLSRPLSVPSSTTSGKSHFETNGDNTIISAKAEFLRRVSNSISHLIDRHGYSRSRASELVLGEIQKGNPLPSEDEIFSAMEKYHLGMNEALEAIVVSSALKKIRREQNLPATKAIENLTSSLTMMKLLAKVESQNQVSFDNDDADYSNCSLQSSSSSSSSNVMSRTPSPKSFLSVVEKMNDKSGPTTPLTPTSSETAPARNFSSRKRSKRGKEEDKSNKKSSTKDDDNAEVLKVAQKVILQQHTRDSNPVQKQDHNNLPPSSSAPPSITNTRMKSPSPREKRELDTILEDRPTAKRQRLDSI